MPKATSSNRKSYDESYYTEPKALNQLNQRTGSPSKTGKSVGVSGTYVTQSITKNKVRKSVEIAARYELSKLDRQVHGRHTIIALVNSDKLEATRSFLTAVGVKFVDITEELTKQ